MESQEPRVLVAQWIERPPGVRKVMGSNPIGTQIFSRSRARVTLFHISHDVILFATKNGKILNKQYLKKY